MRIAVFKVEFINERLTKGAESRGCRVCRGRPAAGGPRGSLAGPEKLKRSGNPGPWCRLGPDPARAAYRRPVDQGWTDALRTLHPDAPMFIVWDYFRDHFARGAGMRLDHFLLSPARLRTAGVDRFVRAQDTASDHAPAWVELE